jgi:hypothetical protein
MGYFANNQCHSTQLAAAQSACSQYPIISTSGTTVYTFSCSSVNATGSMLNLSRTTNGSSTATATTAYLSFPSCDENAKYTDSLTLWGLGALAVLAVWAMKQSVLKLFVPA